MEILVANIIGYTIRHLSRTMNENLVFPPYRSKRAFEEIADQIKQAILAKRLKEGDRLPSERSLAKRFQVGRMTVREALRTLETKGFIKIKKGSGGGAFIGVADSDAVPSIIVDNLILEGLTSTQITEARIALECAAVKSVIENATTEDLNSIAQNIEELETIIEFDHPQDLLSKRINFHLLIAEASHNLLFIMFTRTLMEWARRRLEEHWVPLIEEQLKSYQFHQRLFDSIKRKDNDVAQRLMKDHIEHVGVLIAKNVRQKETL